MNNNFTIEYAFVAIDRFTEVASKINTQIKEIETSLGSMSKVTAQAGEALTKLNMSASSANLGNVAKTLSTITPSTQKIVEPIDKLDSSLQKVVPSAEKIVKPIDKLDSSLRKIIPTTGIARSGLARAKTGISSLSLSVGGAAGKLEIWREKMARIGDQRAMGSYYKMLNLGLPLFLVAKAGIKYEDALQNANSQLSIQFAGTKNQVAILKQLNAEASKYQTTTAISAAQFMSGAAQLGSITHNLLVTKAAMPSLAEYAIYTKQTDNMASAAKSMINAILSGKILGVKLTGATAIQRFQQGIDVINRQLGGVVQNNAKLASVQFEIMEHQFQLISYTILDTLAPALSTLAGWFVKGAQIITPFIQKHQELVKVLGLLLIGSLGLIAVETVFGAALTSVAITLSFFSKAVQGVFVAIKFLETLSIAGAFTALTAPVTIAIGALAILGYALYKVYQDYHRLNPANTQLMANLKRLGEVAKVCLMPITILFKAIELSVDSVIKVIDYLIKKLETIGSDNKVMRFLNAGMKGGEMIGGRVEGFLDRSIAKVEGKGTPPPSPHQVNVNINVKDRNQALENVQVSHSGGAGKVNTNYSNLGANMMFSQGSIGGIV